MKHPDAADVKRTANLLALVPQEPKPRKTGRASWICACPFHEDSTPSMSVRLVEVGWVFRCFGCGEKGTVIDFVMRTERCSFQEAIAKLAGNTANAVVSLHIPAIAKKAYVIPCEMPGCGDRMEVDVADLPYLGENLHADWLCVSERWFCGRCTPYLTRGCTKLPRRWSDVRGYLARACEAWAERKRDEVRAA